ncbi:hypothetical protein L0Y59_00015, partial [Candidatus Uhrbacteria bacterium]|nr:hypothetical protein [Candidatus Uhrbacteria bacterium]
IAAEDVRYRVGDVVDVYVYVYDKGVLVNVPGAENGNVSIVKSTSHNLNQNIEDLPVEAIGAGTYKASYVIPANEYTLYFFYEVTRGDDHEEVTDADDALRIDVYTLSNVADVTFYGQDGISAYPGETVTATVSVTRDGNPYSISGFDRLVLRSPDGDDTNISDYTEISDGRYEVKVSVPQTKMSGDYVLIADPRDASQDTATIRVKVLDVWYHDIDLVGTTASFEVGVADSLGQPVDDADIALFRWGQLIAEGSTNESGLELFSLTGVGDTQYLTGYVVSGLLNQSIGGQVFNTERTPAAHGFDIIYEGDAIFYGVSQEITRQYTAYYDGVPLDSDIYYYVTAEGLNFGLGEDVGPAHVDGTAQAVAAGAADSDALGKFSIAFDTPGTQSLLLFDFESAFANPQGNDFDRDDNRVYETWPENQWDGDPGHYAYAVQGELDGAEDVNADSGDYKLGEPTEVKLELPDDFTAFEDGIGAFWVVGEADPASLNGPDAFAELEWVSWTPGGTDVYIAPSEDGGGYVGKYVVPAFIGDDTKITFVAGYVDSSAGTPHFNSDVVSAARGGVSLFLIFGVVAVIVIAVFLLLRYFRN